MPKADAKPTTLSNACKTREEWLQALTGCMRNSLFREAGAEIPANVRVATSFPSRKALSRVWLWPLMTAIATAALRRHP